ncbi:MAG: hypothetical protein HYR73_00400 [Candidatus Eisenbacteria bacterium]|nr:hypothetical protein [Candidatus Eisenbacteria bacterium]
MATTSKLPVGDDAVLKRTGKTWEQWFVSLDRAGAKKMNHAAIATHLYNVRKLPRWWCQMVVVGYERARGLRQVHERPNGFEIGVSRTIAAPAVAAYRAWADTKTRDRWLPKTKIAIRTASEPKSLRITWRDGKTTLEVNIYAKGPRKSQVAVQHHRLRDATAAAKMKLYWAKTLDRLRDVLEK